MTPKKKRRVSEKGLKCKRLIQTNLKNYFSNKNESLSNEIDEQNVINLLALEIGTTQTITDDSAPLGTSEIVSLGNKIEEVDTVNHDDRIRTAKEREPILFSEPNPIENALLPNENGIVDPDRLQSLTNNISEHNLRFFEL